jgi:hypothetical protein
LELSLHQNLRGTDLIKKPSILLEMKLNCLSDVQSFSEILFPPININMPNSIEGAEISLISGPIRVIFLLFINFKDSESEIG